jgi:hypothetical protein
MLIQKQVFHKLSLAGCLAAFAFAVPVWADTPITIVNNLDQPK